MNSSARYGMNINHTVLNVFYYVSSKLKLKPKYFGQCKTVILKHKNKLSLD